MPIFPGFLVHFLLVWQNIPRAVADFAECENHLLVASRTGRTGGTGRMNHQNLDLIRENKIQLLRIISLSRRKRRRDQSPDRIRIVSGCWSPDHRRAESKPAARNRCGSLVEPPLLCLQVNGMNAFGPRRTTLLFLGLRLCQILQGPPSTAQRVQFGLRSFEACSGAVAGNCCCCSSDCFNLSNTVTRRLTSAVGGSPAMGAMSP
jgi:hypothetical protein